MDGTVLDAHPRLYSSDDVTNSELDSYFSMLRNCGIREEKKSEFAIDYQTFKTNYFLATFPLTPLLDDKNFPIPRIYTPERTSTIFDVGVEFSKPLEKPIKVLVSIYRNSVVKIAPKTNAILIEDL